MSTSIFASRIKPVGIHCRHCNKWHYGKSNVSHDLALKDADRQVENCRKTYHVMGWDDDGAPDNDSPDESAAE